MNEARMDLYYQIHNLNDFNLKLLQKHFCNFYIKD